MAPSPRRILLVDADAFYVAVARLVDPERAGKEPLLIVGGRADGRGVVTSASYEAREYGVQSAMPTARALRLCPDAVVVPVPRNACSRKSREILRVLSRYTPVVEPASIDEFYLDMTGTEQLHGGEPLAETALRMRQEVIDQTSLSVSIGGGTSKLVAKLAAKRAKPRRSGEATGVHIVAPRGEAAFMREHDLGAIPMIGPKFQEILARHGLVTVRDALELELPTLKAWFGDRAGRWLYDRIRGIDHSPVAPRSEAKSIGHEETFPTDLIKDEDLERELLRLTLSVAADLRSNGWKARTVTIKLRDADFTTRQASRTLPRAVASDRPIHDTARALLRKLRRARHTGARLLGVSLSQLVSPESESSQLSFFQSESAEALETERDRKLSRVVDDIHAKYGREGIIRGSHVSPTE